LHLSKYAFLNDLSGSVFSYEAKYLKPDYKIFYHFLEKFKLQANHCLFIDDLEWNIYSAQRIGIESLQFKIGDDLLKRLQLLEII